MKLSVVVWLCLAGLKPVWAGYDDSNWKPWGEWTKCSHYCGGKGTQQRVRDCEYDGGCDKQNTDKRPCNRIKCPEWNKWSTWGQCSEPCGGGLQTRHRACVYDKRFEIRCDGHDTISRVCNKSPCRVDGDWGAWGEYSRCTRICGGGTKIRKRKCNSPAPRHGGKKCKGESHERVHCGNGDCPENGKWGDWAPWSRCTKTCGGGKKTRTRECDNPPPAHGGRKCPGTRTSTERCNEDLCPIHGNWGVFGPWGKCSATCGYGIRIRTRKCNNPAPSANGEYCAGSDEDTKDCKQKDCPDEWWD